MNPLCTLSALDLARRIKQRKLTSAEVVEAHIRQIEKANPALNAVVKDRFDEARAEARAADEQVARTPAEELPPLHGVPCTIKEAFALSGMPQTSGLVARKGFIATEDATTVARLRAAGAIPLGVTNVSELCMWMESKNNVYGRTGSAYDPSRTAGGSSGGEGAVVGAGGAPFGLGADIGGSIRMPAFFNGVFGHKPTGGLVPGTGQYPIAVGDALRYLSTGPIARRAEDLMPLLRVLAGPDGQDQACTHCELSDPATVELRGLTVLDVRDANVVPVSDELIAAQERAALALARRGAKVVPTRIEALRHAIQIWSAMLEAAGGPTFGELLGNGVPVRPGPELVRWLLKRSPYTLPALGLAILERLPKLARARATQFIELGARLRAELVDRIGPNGVMLYPSHTRPAPRHTAPLWPPIQWGYTAIFNVMELPVTQTPLGLGQKGLPLGVQVVGIHGRDHLPIAVALALEEAFGGWVPPERWR